MGRVTVGPASLFDGQALLLRGYALKPMIRKVGAVQLATANTTAINLDGAPVGIIGFWPLGDGVEECFFACRPIRELGTAFVPMQRAGRLIIRGRLHHPSVRKLVALVAGGNAAGHRLARLAGFKDPQAALDGSTRWEMTWAGSFPG